MRAYLTALLFLLSSSAFAAPAVDPAGAVSNTATGTNTITISGFSAAAGDIVFLHVNASFISTGGFAQVSTITGPSLTWHLLNRSTITDTAGASVCTSAVCNLDSEIYWAFTASAITSQAVTVTFQTGQTPASVAAVFGVTGIVSASAPFDSNGSLPAIATSTSESINSVSGISTTSRPDLILTFGAKIYNNQYGGGSTCNLVYNNSVFDSGVRGANIGAWWDVAAAPLSGATRQTFVSGCGANNSALVLVTAIAGSSFSKATVWINE